MSDSNTSGSLEVGAWCAGTLIVALVGVMVWSAVAHHPHPTGDIGFGDIIVGGGTLILAAVTLGSVVLGWRALRDTREGIDVAREELVASRRQVEATERQVEAQQRPVLVPVVDTSRKMTPPGHDSSQAKPRLSSKGLLLLPLENIGTGPALDVRVGITGRDPDGSYGAELGELEHSGYVFAIGAKALAGIPVAFVGRASPSVIPSFDVLVTYKDLAGQTWKTSAQYVSGGIDGTIGFYSNPEIAPRQDAV